MKKLLAVITAHNRRESLVYLLGQISSQASVLKNRGVDIQVMIFHDGLTDMFDNMNLPGNVSYTQTLHLGKKHGKENYWLQIDNIFKFLKHLDYDYYLMLPDDSILLPNFFAKAIELWEVISDPKKACLNLYIDEARFMIRQWDVPVKPTVKGFGSRSLIHTGWVDMEMIFGKEFLEALNYEMFPVVNRDWQKNPALGSGVGHQISQRLHKKGLNIYQCHSSLSFQEAHPSVMNPIRGTDTVPKVNMRDRNSKIICGIATVHRRKKWLIEAVRSLSIQCDEIHIYLDDYLENTDPELRQIDSKCKLFFYNAIDTKYPLGSSGKFFGLSGRKNVYCFTADDDLVYPPDYTYKMVNRIEFNRRKRVVCAMGSIYHGIVDNYWQDRIKYSLFDQQNLYQIVNVPGTGCTAFHSDTLQLEQSDFMLHKDILELSDIWFACILKEKNIPALLVPHPGKWVINNPQYVETGSLYLRSRGQGKRIADKLDKHVLA